MHSIIELWQKYFNQMFEPKILLAASYDIIDENYQKQLIE